MEVLILTTLSRPDRSQCDSNDVLQKLSHQRLQPPWVPPPAFTEIYVCLDCCDSIQECRDQYADLNYARLEIERRIWHLVRGEE
jgi:hypothetical protein